MSGRDSQCQSGVSGGRGRKVAIMSGVVALGLLPYKIVNPLRNSLLETPRVMRGSSSSLHSGQSID